MTESCHKVIWVSFLILLILVVTLVSLSSYVFPTSRETKRGVTSSAGLTYGSILPILELVT